jgi:cellobiose-specific phosphotransferase system component IIC
MEDAVWPLLSPVNEQMLLGLPLQMDPVFIFPPVSAILV